MKKYSVTTKKIYVIAIMLTVCMLVLTGCSEAEPEETPKFSGVATAVTTNSISVGVGETQIVFTIDEATKMSGGASVVIDDEVTVTYDGDLKNKPIALNINIDKAAPVNQVFVGIVKNVKAASVLVEKIGSTETHSFLFAENIEVQGSLSEGDEISVTYNGVLSKQPIATKIVVKAEKPEPEKHTITGVVVEVTKTSVVIKVSSNHGYMFTLNNNTVINGVNGVIAKDNKITVTYTGDISGEPIATIIDIKK